MQSLEKRISIDDLRAFVPERDRRRIDIQEAQWIIGRFYCKALVLRGVCPGKCHKCKDAITSMFVEMIQAKKPTALLTWRAKDRSAAMIEKLIENQKHEFPAQETDPFKALFPKRENPKNIFLQIADSL